MQSIQSSTSHFVFKYIFLMICMFIPGGSLLNTHKHTWGMAIPFLGLVWVLTCSYTRWVITPTGFVTMLSGLLLLHTLSYLIGLKANINVITVQAKQWSYLVLLLIVNISIMISCHCYKNKWLGFTFYHIPSASMSPTLQTGDVVLVDTWIYRKDPVNINDVIVIKHPKNNTILAKRLTNKRHTKGYTELHVEGDNTNKSIDSRHFGWTHKENLLGKITFIWFSFNQHKRYLMKL